MISGIALALAVLCPAADPDAAAGSELIQPPVLLAPALPDVDSDLAAPPEPAPLPATILEEGVCQHCGEAEGCCDSCHACAACGCGRLGLCRAQLNATMRLTHDWLREPCNLPQRLPYYPAAHGNYYFRPYHPAHIRWQQQAVTIWGGDPRNPYSNEIFRRVYKEWAETRKQRRAEEIPKPDQTDKPGQPMEPPPPDEPKKPAGEDQPLLPPKDTPDEPQNPPKDDASPPGTQPKPDSSDSPSSQRHQLKALNVQVKYVPEVRESP